MSSLISRLVERGKSPVINSIEEMVARGDTDGWNWGTVTMTGAFSSLLKSSSNPDFIVAAQFMLVSERYRKLIKNKTKHYPT